MTASRESGKFPLRALLLLAILVLAGLAGYTWYKTGRIGLWPAPVTSAEKVRAEQRQELRAIRKEIRRLRAKIAMGLPGTPRARMEEKAEELEQQAEILEEKISRLQRR